MLGDIRHQWLEKKANVSRPIPPAALERAFPDFNCEHVGSGRWRRLRDDFQKLLGFGEDGVRSNSGKEFKLRWRRGVRRLAMHHGFAHSTYPAANNFSHADLTRSCPLGDATLAAADMVSSLLRISKFEQAGQDAMVAREAQLYLRPASVFLVRSLRKFREPWHLVLILPAARWPVLQLLAGMERHVLPSLHSAGQCKLDRSSGYTAMWSELQQVARVNWLFDTRPKVHSFSGRWNPLSEILQVASACPPVKSLECLPLTLQQQMVHLLVFLENQHPPSHSDPNYYAHHVDEVIRELLLNEDFWKNLLSMPFAVYPFFGFWLHMQQLVTHRLELPALSTTQLAKAFGVKLAREPPGAERLPAAFDALDALKRKVATKSVVITTVCWGQRMASRLELWLKAVARKARRALGVLVACLDSYSLASCRSRNAQPSFCADAREWPRSGLSKLMTVALSLQSGVDVLWLDLDTVVLQDPVPRISRALQDQSLEMPDIERQMLFSIEADSLNCVNSGAYFIRSSPMTQRFLGTWASVYFGHPASTDQQILYLMLGLRPRMDLKVYAESEGLLASGVRARAFGSFQTPPWGALEPRVDFTVSIEVNYGGVERGHSQLVAVLHLLDSFPPEGLIYSVYHDLRAEGLDVVEEILQGLFDKQNATTAMALVRRNERTWGKARRDCRSSFNPGR